MTDPFAPELDALRARALHRRLREMTPARDGNPTVTLPAAGPLANFSSNDYLGLAADPILRDAAHAAIDEWGVGAGASRLVSGTRPIHRRLEDALARFKHAEAALTFSSGYAAAHGALGALLSKDDVVILDKLVHACFVDAARACGAVRRVFPHHHLGKLEDHLTWARREYPLARVLVVTEAVFSMDGDRAPLREIVELKDHHGALLLVDEAHSVGVVGPHGRGLAAELGVEDRVDVRMGTLSKALGAAGGYLAGSRSLVDLLVNRARSFIYSTATPPPVAAAALAAVEFLETAEGERRRLALWANVRQLHAALPAAPEISNSNSKISKFLPTSAILPWVVGGEQAALDLSARLADAGFLAPAIRFPTVARGAARLRLTVTARHRPETIADLGRELGKLVNAPGG